MKGINVLTGVRPKRKGGRISKKTSRYIMLLILIFLSCCMIYIWSSSKKIQLGYEISKLKRKEAELLEINRELKLEISVLKSPQRLERIAKERFGLKHPEPDQIIVLR